MNSKGEQGSGGNRDRGFEEPGELGQANCGQGNDCFPTGNRQVANPSIWADPNPSTFFQKDNGVLLQKASGPVILP
jgi:hypothetical protein